MKLINGSLGVILFFFVFIACAYAENNQIIFSNKNKIGACKTNCKYSYISNCTDLRGDDSITLPEIRFDNAKVIYINGKGCNKKGQSTFHDGNVSLSITDVDGKIIVEDKSIELSYLKCKDIHEKFILPRKSSGKLLITISVSDWCSYIEEFTIEQE